MRRWDRGSCCSQPGPEKVRRRFDMRGCIANGKTEIGFFRLEKRRCQPLRLRPTRSVNRMPLSVIWTELQGENRPIGCFHLLFHLSFHLEATAKYSHSSQLASISAVLVGGRRDGKWAVATPLFGGNCRPGALRVPLGFALLRGRHRPFPVPHHPLGLTISGAIPGTIRGTIQRPTEVDCVQADEHTGH